MNSLLKYQHNRHLLLDGDIILCKSSKPIARAIQMIDKAEYHHSGIIFISNGRVFVMDAHPGKGVHPAYLSHRIEQQKWSDFTILRPRVKKDIKLQALRRVFELADKYIPYDIKEVLKIARYAFTGRYKEEKDNGKQICSQFTQQYAVECGIESHDPLNVKRPFFTPQDHIRYSNNKFKVIV